jgi:hypothetical protein
MCSVSGGVQEGCVHPPYMKRWVHTGPHNTCIVRDSYMSAHTAYHSRNFDDARIRLSTSESCDRDLMTGEMYVHMCFHTRKLEVCSDWADF